MNKKYIKIATLYGSIYRGGSFDGLIFIYRTQNLTLKYTALKH